METEPFAAERKFALNTMNPDKAPRMAPVIQAIRRRLASRPGEWVSHDDLTTSARVAGDLAEQTITNRIAVMVKIGMIEKRGGYQRWFDRRVSRMVAKDTRAYRLGDWPSP